MKGGNTEQESEEGKWREGIQSRSLRRGGRRSGGRGYRAESEEGRVRRYRQV